MMDVLVVGDLNPDIVVWGTDLRPIFGQVEQLVDGVIVTVGGSGAITACGLARLGFQAGLCAVVGDDAMGASMLSEVSGRGVDVSMIRVDPTTPTGASVILTAHSDRAVLTAPGTVTALTRIDLEAIADGVATHVHVASPFLLQRARPHLARFMGRMRSFGATVSLDVNWDPSGEWSVDDLLAETDILLPNQAEAKELTGLDDGFAAIVALAERVETVAVKQGGKGGRCRWSGGDVTEPVAVDVDAVDMIGAGDGFDAGFLAATVAGRGRAEALRWAVAFGTLSTRCRGGVDGQPTIDELANVLEST